MTTRSFFLCLPILALLAFTGNAQTVTIDAGARKGIDAGNQAWIDGMKQGTPASIAATYADDAVDCDAAGACIRGRAAVAAHFQERLARFGRARSASVTSMGAVQQGAFVYEWGRAEASFGSGQKLSVRYLTAWQKQPDGSWKIFRNLAIPE